jgi:hypothetical protein
MQILIDIPDSLSTEKIDRIIEKIENQLERVTYSIKLEGKPSHDAELSNNQGMKKFLDWCDRHKTLVDDFTMPSREERNAR